MRSNFSRCRLLTTGAGVALGGVAAAATQSTASAAPTGGSYLTGVREETRSRVVTRLADRRADDDPRKSLGITAADVELLISGWSDVKAVDLDRLACFALHR
ncbi:hypothetical protein [Streptomyces sp. NRRL B-3229]|uniref:hypothetical protein n=1 Tax=Streptomyces sp. NRRL B-3229 TaxID=1463836 RepID=UPI0004BFF4F4|nr:hypothetical protein [Streptomyces sp. NRRL B-3229]